MKTIAILILSFFFSTLLFSQTIDKLDVKNGFKDFTLGSEFSKWQNQLEFKVTLDNGAKRYQYKGNCCDKVFSYPIELIELTFFNNKLVLISLKTEKFQKSYSESGKYTDFRKDDFESINYSFKNLFGPHQHVDKSTQDGNPTISFLWIGKKVRLYSTYVNYGIKGGDRQEIDIADSSFLNNGSDEGF